MKRLLTTTALAISALCCVPAMAQQAPLSPNAPNPSAPPAPEGPTTQVGSSGSGAMTTGDATMQRDKHATKSSKQKNTGQRAKKPREQDAAPTATPTAPSGPKGDSPDPLPKQ